MLGLSLDQIEPTLDTWEQRVHPDDRERVNDALDAHLRGETEYYDTEHRMETATGEWKWIRDVGRVAERDDDGEPIRAVGIHIDISEQKRQRQELEQSETIIQALSDAVYVLDEDGQFTYVNDEFAELVGYDKETILGSTPSLIKKETTVERAEEELAQLLSSDGPETTTFEIPVQTRDGDSIICEDNMGVLPYDGDSFNGSVGTLRDVTERKERQQQLKLVDRVLRHNVRNDMNVIRGGAEIIYNNTSGKPAKYAKQIIGTSNKLIDTTEIERKMAKLFTDSTDPITLDVAPLLQQVTKNIRAEFPEAIVTVECPDGIAIQAKSQFRQAIEELLTNAIIHNPDDAPEVEIGVIEDIERVQIRIADTGPRIPKMERDVLVGNKERTPLDHGSGLGLWFVQFLVSRSGGAIRFEKNSPTGNIVILELPGGLS
jgi:PAS domain S-box/PAS domain S-box